MDEADEYYLQARDAVLEAARELERRQKRLRTADGTILRVNRKPPLRVFLLIIQRWAPGAQSATAFNFQRDGRVSLHGGPQSVPLREAIASGHDPWASREELLELATQIKNAEPDS
jgi:hypothetical protein